MRAGGTERRGKETLRDARGVQLSLYRTVAGGVRIRGCSRVFTGGGKAGRRLTSHGRRSSLELLSHGVGIFVPCRRGTRDEFNSDWSLSITSSLGTLFSSPSSSQSDLRGLAPLVSLLAAAISHLIPSLSFSFSFCRSFAVPLPFSFSLPSLRYSRVPLTPQRSGNTYSSLFDAIGYPSISTLLFSRGSGDPLFDFSSRFNRSGRSSSPSYRVLVAETQIRVRTIPGGAH